MKYTSTIYYLLLLGALCFMTSCDDDDMMDDGEEEEEITRVQLTFAPDGGGEVVTAVFFDADGEGSGAPTIDDITLTSGVTYTLGITLTNTLEEEDEDITEEILTEAADHMFFFGFADGAFSNPAGNGNIDNRADAVNYNDADDNGLPVGLSTTWTAGASTSAATGFNIILKHQPESKSATSSVSDGGTDVNITFNLTIQ